MYLAQIVYFTQDKTRLEVSLHPLTANVNVTILGKTEEMSPKQAADLIIHHATAGRSLDRLTSLFLHEKYLHDIFRLCRPDSTSLIGLRGLYDED